MRLPDFLLNLIERHPSVGYLGAATPTVTGFWALVEQATKLGALLSILLGIAVGVVTFRVQLIQAQRLKRENSKGRDRRPGGPPPR